MRTVATSIAIGLGSDRRDGRLRVAHVARRQDPVITNRLSPRVAAVRDRSRAGFASAWLRYRPGVVARIPVARATFGIAALSGGSSCATALSWNACPFRATLIPHHCPLLIDSNRATTLILTGGGTVVIRDGLHNRSFTG